MKIENPFEHEIVEHYSYRTPPPPRIDATSPFTANVWLSHLRKLNVEHTADIKGFNTLGFKDNSTNVINKNPTEYNNMDAFPADTLDHKYSQGSYWKIVKKIGTGSTELLSDITLSPKYLNQCSPDYNTEKAQTDRFTSWSFDLLPGVYSFIYLSGATKIAADDNFNQVSGTLTTNSKTKNIATYNEKEPNVNTQRCFAFYCKYGELPGYTDIAIDAADEDTATMIIQNKILAGEINGILRFEVTEASTVNIWFNDIEPKDNVGSIRYQLYRGYPNATKILKEFMSSSKTANLIKSITTPVSVTEANQYLQTVLSGSANAIQAPLLNDTAIGYQYYVSRVNESLLVTEVALDEVNNDLYVIGGPFASLDEATEYVEEYCNANNLEYEQMSEMVYVVGDKE